MNYKTTLRGIFSALFILIAVTSGVFAEGNDSLNQQLSLPAGYGGITLGMSVEEVKAALKKNPQFGYRGDRDVSLLPGGDRTLIETDTTRSNPNSFLTQCWFQFYKEKLYIITINVKTTKMDHYSIFTTLCSKYGNPQSMNPQKSEWKDGNVIMSLEKPLTLKYTDQQVFESLLDEAAALDSAEEISRQNFLEGL